MDGAKKWFNSLTIWGAIMVVIGLGITQFTGVDASDQLTMLPDLIVKWIELTLQIVGVVMTIIGRIRATKVLK